jgi:hypothetical protein
MFLLGGIGGSVYSFRTAMAQGIYHDLKFGTDTVDFDGISDDARVAQHLYPVNYRLCSWVAQQAWDQYAATGESHKMQLNEALEWSARAVELNPYPRDIRESRRKSLEETNLAEAITDWSAFVDWNFWDPYNHAVLLELFVKANNLEGAFSELKWVRGTPYAVRSIDLLRALMEKEFTAPSVKL